MLEQFNKPSKGEEVAVIKTNHGDIYVRLFSEIAPKAVENFKTHARNGYYSDGIFHRVIKDFMIQGGDPDGTGMGGESIWGTRFEDEFHPEYRNFRGALSMANAGPNTNGSQFFIVEKSEVDAGMLDQMKGFGEERGYPDEIVSAYEKVGGTPWLDGSHTVFGQVYQGMDIVEAIGNVKVGPGDRPIQKVEIQEIEIIEYQ